MIQYQKEYVVGVGYETINGAPQAEYPNIGAGGLIIPGGSVELKCFGKVFVIAKRNLLTNNVFQRTVLFEGNSLQMIDLSVASTKIAARYFKVKFMYVYSCYLN